MNRTKYTLVQHSAYAGKRDMQFRHAVEETSFTATPAVLERIKKAGGLVFDNYGDASDAAETENYPPEVTGLIPHVRGTFSRLTVNRMRVYVPKGGVK